ncbi:tRNA (adenosine(37)-N6)-dimethylallyltransferase MiaA [Atopobacter phocae]|uniref:tRNA (adenosine(37)-N6)-dimethylallyltransferase MiaA n=1 Tax=Atopobacter phocae TaxID=136492 RepID=UPI000472D8E3|nr:tRNA (adenosine(37)-N6)-dimethylallyltransferase MiaA [Atopobacter phocae]
MNEAFKQHPILMVAGPTAVGKTALAIELAKRYNGEIINADSMQVYKELSIGTAKPTEAEQAQVPHHLIDTHSFTEKYDMDQFKKEALQTIEELHENGKLPIIVGGSGLYLQSLIEDYQLGGFQKDPTFYKQWENRERQEILNRLGLPENDETPKRRLLRQLEIKLAENTSDAAASKDKQLLHQTKGFVLTCERSVLYERINHRVDLMITEGLLEEARMVYDWRQNHYQKGQIEPTALKAIGYKELFPYFESKRTLEDCILDLKQATRRYAKRQQTWFRNRMPYLTPVDLITSSEGISHDDLYEAIHLFLN